MFLVPSLQRLDTDPVTNAERQAAAMLFTNDGGSSGQLADELLPLLQAQFHAKLLIYLSQQCPLKVGTGVVLFVIFALLDVPLFCPHKHTGMYHTSLSYKHDVEYFSVLPSILAGQAVPTVRGSSQISNRATHSLRVQESPLGQGFMAVAPSSVVRLRG